MIRFITILLFCYSFTACSQSVSTVKEEVNEEHDWTGTAYYIARSVSSSASNAQYVSTESESFNEYRMEATLSRGLGKATSSMQIMNRHKHTGRTGGKSTTSETFTRGVANGNADTDIAVEIVEEDQTYSFFIPIPACSGKKYVTKTDGEPEITTFGEEEAMIQVEFQKLGNDPNVLTGEIRERNEDGNGGITETILFWSFVKRPLDVELAITPNNYETWLPVPGKDESSAGSSMEIGLELVSKDGKKPKLKAKSFALQLTNTSTERGITINYPAGNKATPKPDFRFRGNAANDGQLLTLAPADGVSASVTLDCFDGGATTELQAEAILENGIRIVGVLKTAKDVSTVLIPKRKQGSKIADIWLQQHQITAEDEDLDRSKGNNNIGDGLTAYQEYRGVMSRGKFIRLDPKKKELGVRTERDVATEFEPGLNLFTSASGVEVIRLFPEELGEDRILNSNRAQSEGPAQHALLLLDYRLPENLMGRNDPEKDTAKTPKQSLRTLIDLVQIKSKYAEQKAVVERANEQMPYTLEDEIANTVAHELSHGVHVKHHGPNSTEPRRTAINKKSPPYYMIFGSDGAQLKIPKDGWELDPPGDKGNESSGDLNCIIAYTSKYQWYYEKRADGNNEYRSVPVMPPGTILCTSAEGTGINSTGYFGRATYGGCLAQIRVKDKP